MAREIRILHTADTHLGYRQYHSEVRRQDFFKAFELVINDAIDMQVDAVVHAGDLFDSRNPTLEDLLETISILSRLKAVEIPFFGIVGNHESKQNTQWLDLFEEMGLAARLGTKPQILETRGGNGDSVAIYGIDSVPKSKIPIFDYSGFETPESCNLPESCRKLLVMHQIVQPFPYAEWDCAEVLEKLPFKIDAILLGDYHKYEKIKVGDAWVTYPGSTERNSASESEPRSYNIITLSGEEMEISRRTIPTRDFLTIPVTLCKEENPFEQIFSAVNEHLEELSGSVVFLEISGDSGIVLSLSEIEEHLLSKGVLVSRVKDRRIKESLPADVLKVAFSDPDHAVADEIKRLNLNDGGLIIDEIVRNPNISRSRVDEETEGRLSKLVEALDFKDPNFKIEISIRPDDEIKYIEDSNPAEETEFQGDIESGTSTLNLKISGSVPDSSLESEHDPVVESEHDSMSKLPSDPSSEPVAESKPLSEFLSELPSKSISELASSELASSELASSEPVSSEPVSSELTPENAFKLAIPCEASEFDTEKTGNEIKLSKEEINKPEQKIRTISQSEVNSGAEFNSEKEETGDKKTDKVKTDELKVNNLSEEKSTEVPEKNSIKVPGEKSDKVSDIGGAVSSGQKKGKGKPAIPRQYNLGDYL